MNRDAQMIRQERECEILGCSSDATRANTRNGQMRVLIACEFSGMVRDAFATLGHDAWSCDLLPCERGGNHIQGDVIEHLNDGWDLMVAHPPCTHLAVSGARWFETKRVEQRKAIWFFLELANANIPRIAIENPVGIMSTNWRKPDQIIQPWQFGHGETKATCLWLKNLPRLKPTKIVEGRLARVHREPPSPERWKNRSRTLQGIADAMAEQWANTQRDNFPTDCAVSSYGAPRESTQSREATASESIADNRGGENLSVPSDAEESYSDYLRERDHQQEERDREEAYWAIQGRLQEETDDGYHEFGFKHESL